MGQPCQVVSINCSQNTRRFSSTQRQRAKRQRLSPTKQGNQAVESGDDVWSWIGNSYPKWTMTMMQYNLRIFAGSIFAAQTYTVYEWFRFGQIRWHKRVFWWVPNYVPVWLNDLMYKY